MTCTLLPVDNLVSILIISMLISFTWNIWEFLHRLTWGEGVELWCYFCWSLLSTQKKVIKNHSQLDKKDNKIKVVA